MMNTEPKITLEPAQERSVSITTDILGKHGFALLFGETRTGKTAISVISVVNEMKRQNIKGHVLFVTTKEAIRNIVKQMDGIPYADVQGTTIASPGRKKKLRKELHPDKTNVIVINYESVGRFMKGYPEVYSGVKAAIIDECHKAVGSYRNAANPNRRIRTLVPACENKLLVIMSATPTPESWAGIYFLLRIAGDRSPYAEYHVNSKYGFHQWCRDGYVDIQKKKKAWNLPDIALNYYPDYSKANMEKINIDIDRFRHTLTQIEVGFKTKVKERILRVLMTKKTVRAYKYMLSHGCLLYANDENKYVLVDTAVAKKIKAHQIVGGGIIQQDKTTITWDRSKIVAILNDMLGREYIKSAIYYKYIFEKEIIETELRKRNIPIYDCDVEFNENTHGVFVKQIISGREGINISSSNVIYMYNIDFAYLSYCQVKDRILTLYKDEPSEIVWVFSQTGFEETIYDTVVREKTDFTARHYKKISKRLGDEK